VVFTGGRSEVDTIEGIRLGMGEEPSLSLAGQLDLGELAALIARAPLLVSNNTGPVHVAASVGTPVVDLYALTNPQHTPWGVPNRVLNHDVPCKYCYKSLCPEGHHDCLRLVTPGQVVEAAIELLGMGAPDGTVPATTRLLA
jgi:ADP-heptose:LPS heptosyltransferase